MKVDNLDRMVRGWFIGDFSPSLCKTDAVEVGVKFYEKGDHEEWHYHKVSKEFTVIISGCALLNGKKYNTGDIIIINPGEGTDFDALTDVVTTVVKIPSAKNDKYVKGE